MKITMFNDYAELPDKKKFYLATLDEDDDQTIIIRPMQHGRRIKSKESDIIASVCDTENTLENLPEDAKIYVHEDAENVFEHIKYYCALYEKYNGNINLILQKMDEDEANARLARELEEDGDCILELDPDDFEDENFDDEIFDDSESEEENEI